MGAYVFAALVAVCALTPSAHARWDRQDLDWGEDGYTQLAYNSPKEGVGFIVSCNVRGPKAGSLSIETKLDTGGQPFQGTATVDYKLAPRSVSLRTEIRVIPSATVLAVTVEPHSDDADVAYELLASLQEGGTLVVHQQRLGISAPFVLDGAKLYLVGLSSCRSHFLNRAQAQTPQLVAEEILAAARQSCFPYVADPTRMATALPVSWWTPDADIARAFSSDDSRTVLGAWRYQRGPVSLIVVSTRAAVGLASCLIVHKGQSADTYEHINALLPRMFDITVHSREAKNSVRATKYLGELSKSQRAHIETSYSSENRQTWLQVIAR